MAFKFPDLSDVWFKCVTRLCIKKFNHLIVTGKSENDLCKTATKCNIGNRERRRTSTTSDMMNINDSNVIVVRGKISVNDDVTTYSYSAQESSEHSSAVCMTKDKMLVISIVTVTICLSTFITILLMFYNKYKLRRNTLKF
ncbi:hypothetical protein DICVIV_07492 [Dictyocaulus viviparus]|uniref:ZP domain-containing protein n=1 Tax=Dictyocaulus viviparus TaxID=29172 RepID=A0A0D8XP57_DICVI|nr:hypothetical protein DICVIV_07492 [Dictyocaulus viviparus]